MQQAIYVKHPIANILTIKKIVTIHYHEMDKDYAFEGEAHDFWELVYTDKGTVVITAGGQSLPLPQGHIAFHSPNEFHQIRADGKTAPNVFVITFEAKSAVMRYFRGLHLPLPHPLKPLIAAMIREGKAAFSLPCFNPGLKELTPRPGAPLGAEQLVRLNLEQLLIQLLRASEATHKKARIYTSKSKFEEKAAQAVCAYLERNVYAKITIEQVCAHTLHSKTRLSSAFSRVMGQGIMQYHTALKITEAKRLIREGGRSFAEIAFMLGFSSPQYFTKRFRQLAGMTPSEYAATVHPID